MYRRQIGCLIGIVILLAWVSVTLAGTVSEEARRFMTRGMAAVEMAKTPQDYKHAAREFEHAAELAPNWPDVYFNLGSVQAKAENYDEAIRHYKRYLELAPNSPDAAKVREEIYKLEYRQERFKKVAELAGVWRAGRLSYTISVNNSEFNAKGTEKLSGFDNEVRVIKDTGFPSGKVERVSKGQSQVVFKGRLDGLSIKGIRHRSSYIEETSECRIPDEQSEFTGTVSEDSNRITLNFQKSMYQADCELGLLPGLGSCTSVQKIGESPREIVLTR